MGTKRTSPNKKLKCVAYFRVSTASQAKSGLGLEAQEAAVTQYAAANGFQVIDSFTDAGLSGKLDLTQRPGLIAAIDKARSAGADAIVVAKLCRLSRDVLNSLLIERSLDRLGIRILSTAGEGTDSCDPAAALLRNLLQAVNAYEGKVISARIKVALAAKKARSAKDGTWAGGRPPKGFTVDEKGYLTPNEDFPLVHRAVALRMEGLSLAETARLLGLPNRTLVHRWTRPWLENPKKFLEFVAVSNLTSEPA